jgi:hypothetical protein
MSIPDVDLSFTMNTKFGHGSFFLGTNDTLRAAHALVKSDLLHHSEVLICQL